MPTNAEENVANFACLLLVNLPNVSISFTHWILPITVKFHNPPFNQAETRGYARLGPPTQSNGADFKMMTWKRKWWKLRRYGCFVPNNTGVCASCNILCNLKLICRWSELRSFSAWAAYHGGACFVIQLLKCHVTMSWVVVIGQLHAASQCSSCKTNFTCFFFCIQESII